VAGVLLGGPDILIYLVMAFGGALLVGNLAAVVRPPQRAKEGDLERAPLGRSLVMALVGLVAVVWSFATLVSR
jgi:hypothetical protein